MSVTLYQTILTKADAGFISFIGSTSASVAGSIKPVATTLLMIYVMLWGWSMMRGVIEEPITDGVTRIVRLSIIVAIAISVGHYSGYVADWVWQSPDALASTVTGQNSSNSIQFLDNLLDKYFKTAAQYLKKANENSSYGIPDLNLFFCGILIYVFAVLVTAYGAFLLFLAKMALAILLGVGPIFILLAIFESTKKFLDAWIGQVCNYVFLVMLAAAVCKLILVFLEQYIGNVKPNATGDLGIADAVQLIALSAIGFLVLMQVPTIASALGGGAAISTLGAAGAAWSKIKGATATTARGAKNLLSGKTLADMRQERRRKATMASWAKKNPGLASRAASRLMNKNSPNKVEKG
jgi:type IV secretion system protein VirB6